MKTDDTVWHPRLQALHRLWLDVAPAPGLLPGRQHVGPELLKPWLPWIWLLDVVWDDAEAAAPPRLRYRLAGTRMVEMRGGHNPTGMWLEESNPTQDNDNPTLLRAQAVAMTRQPSWRRGRPNNLRVETVGTVENLFLPLAADGTAVDMLLCCSLYFTLDGRQT